MIPSGRRRKGKRGEKEVAALWRACGWPDAVPTPGSGGLRPSGAGDLSPWPGDIARVRPWLVEVKFDENVKRPGRGIQGEGFIRRTLIDLEKLEMRHSLVAGAARSLPVLFARANLTYWRVFVPAWLFARTFGIEQTMTWGADEWIELPDVDIFFEHFALPPERS